VVAARTLGTYLRFVARRTTYLAIDADGKEMDLATIASVVGQLAERLIATYWIDNALPFATLSFAHPGLVALARGFRFLIDDTYGGRLSALSIASAGGRYAMLALPGNPLRLKQVSAVIAERRSCIFPVDGGGPYHEVGTGIAGLATALRASIVPMSVRSSRDFIMPHRSRIRVPMPGGRIVVAVGAAIEVRKADLRTEVAGRVKHALDAVGTLAGRIAGGEPLPAPRFAPHVESR
jgi:hypothetical protein